LLACLCNLLALPNDHFLQFVVCKLTRHALDRELLRHGRGNNSQVQARVFVSHNRDDAAAMLREVLAQRSEKISAELIARSFFLPARKSPNVNEPLVFGIERYGKQLYSKRA